MNRNNLLSGVGLIFFLAILGCSPADHIYRGVPPDQVIQKSLNARVCDTVVDLGDENDETLDPSPRPQCYLSKYKVAGADQNWAKEPGGGKIKTPGTFRLSFVEMPERKSELLLKKQLDNLQTELRSEGQSVVVVYIHGWRHDAKLGNLNVKNFRTLLGYTRSALNARCIETNSYCDAELTGVYVSWRGRSFNERPEDLKKSYALAGALPTAWGRKNQSERLGAASKKNILGQVLKGIEAPLHLKAGDSAHDKMLVVGHSYGANMLAQYLRPIATAELGAYQKEKDGDFDPLVGDLAVLINPASSAENWTDIQTKMRRKAGIPDDVHWVTRSNDVTGEEWDKVLKWNRMFPKSQRPVYLSLTATRPWGKYDKVKDEAYDSATGLAFPLSRGAVLQLKKTKRVAIGHYHPDYEEYSQSNQDTYLRINSAPLGVSHEFIVNSGVKEDTLAKNAGDPNFAWCGTSHGWLREAAKKAGGLGRNWDSGSGDRALLSNLGGAEIQFRHMLNLQGRLRAESVAQSTSPFWNVRAHSTALVGHGGFVNFGTWCGLNKLLLDDATSRNLFKNK